MSCFGLLCSFFLANSRVPGDKSILCCTGDDGPPPPPPPPSRGKAGSDSACRAGFKRGDCMTKELCSKNYGDANAFTCGFFSGLTCCTPKRCRKGIKFGLCLKKATCSSLNGDGFMYSEGARGCGSTPNTYTCCIGGSDSAKLLDEKSLNDTSFFDVLEADDEATKSWLIPLLVVAGVVGVAMFAVGIVCFIKAKKRTDGDDADADDVGTSSRRSHRRGSSPSSRHLTRHRSHAKVGAVRASSVRSGLSRSNY